jgi:phosphoenolpyruvate carboxykinase (ATP)
VEIPGVPADVLNPRTTWADPNAYDDQAKELATMFRDNFAKFGTIDAAIRNAGPKV